MAELIDPAVPHAFGVNSAALLFSVCILFPIAGHLSDRYGRLFIMTIGGISMMVLSPMLIVVVGTRSRHFRPPHSLLNRR
jgi:MFS family permease